ncbi:hypothetical protein ACFQXA_18035 [Nocardiopsis composta]
MRLPRQFSVYHSELPRSSPDSRRTSAPQSVTCAPEASCWLISPRQDPAKESGTLAPEASSSSGPEARPQ